MEMRAVRALFLAVATIAAAVLAFAVTTAGAADAAPRVLVIEFENDVNPVTAQWAVDAGLVRRRRDPVRPPPQGDQRRGRVTAGAGRGARPQRRLGRAGGPDRRQHRRAGGAARGRDRRDRADAAGAPGQ